jgi:hypothetical protein
MSRARGIPARGRRWQAPAAVLAGLCAVVALVSCGAGSSGRGQGPTRSAAAAGGAPRHLAVAAPDPVSETGGSTEISAAAHPTGPDNDEVSASGAGPVEVCGLVARSAAVRILGRGVRAAERPQGPTCVYAGSGREITLALEEVPLPKLPAGARKAQRLRIAGRTAWCRRYESDSVVVVGLSGERVLRVTGPCQAGVRFAARALRRIST